MIDYKKYNSRKNKTTIGQRMALSRRLSAVRKRFVRSVFNSVQHFLKRFVNGYPLIKKKNRKNQTNVFLSFMYKHVLISKAVSFNLDVRKKQVKKFLHKQLRIISKKLSVRIRKYVWINIYTKTSIINNNMTLSVHNFMLVVLSIVPEINLFKFEKIKHTFLSDRIFWSCKASCCERKVKRFVLSITCS